MIFRQLFDAESSTYTYVLADASTREALIIDPVREHVARDLDVLRELNLTLKYVFETHVHADHVTGAGELRRRTGAEIVVGAAAGVTGANRMIRDGETVAVGSLRVRALATPGHTDGCTSYHVGDRVFTGDALLIRTAGRTDFQQGSAATLYRSVTDKLYSLPVETLVYPGHDYTGRTVSTIGEEMAFNQRISSKQTPDGFATLMAALKLPPPKRLNEAVPANLRCGDE